MTGSCWRDSRTYSYVGNYQFTEYVQQRPTQRENTPTHTEKTQTIIIISSSWNVLCTLYSCVAMWNSPKLFLLTGVKSLLTQPRNLHSIRILVYLGYIAGRTILYMLSALLSSWVSTELTRRVTFNSHKNAHTHSPSVLYIYIYKYIYISMYMYILKKRTHVGTGFNFPS